MDEYPEYDFYNSGVEGDGTKRRRKRKGEEDDEGCNQHDSFRAALTGLQCFLWQPLPTFRFKSF